MEIAICADSTQPGVFAGGGSDGGFGAGFGGGDGGLGGGPCSFKGLRGI